MWWRLSKALGSDPATKPRAMSHRARCLSVTEFHFMGSTMGLRGVNCALQPLNIFPEWPDEAQQINVELQQASQPHTSHLCKTQHKLKQIHKGKKNVRKMLVVEKQIKPSCCLILS